MCEQFLTGKRNEKNSLKYHTIYILTLRYEGLTNSGKENLIKNKSIITYRQRIPCLFEHLSDPSMHILALL